MKITIEIDSENEMEKLSAFLKTFNINAVAVVSKETANSTVIKGDKKIDPKGLFGIWSAAPRAIENVRGTGWNRKAKKS